MSLRRAPVGDFGFGIINPHISQGCAWIQSIVDHTWTSSPTGQLLKIAVEDAQLKMGVTSDLATQPQWNPLQWFTTKSWIHSCVDFAWKHDVRISPLRTTIPLPQLRNKGIMEAFSTFIDNITTLQGLNRCRMQKHVLWLSDVFSEDGTTITSQSYSTCTHFSPYKWPIKHHTTTTDWAQWCQCIATLADCFTLGQWLLPEYDYYQRSEALLSPTRKPSF